MIFYWRVCQSPLLTLDLRSLSSRSTCWQQRTVLHVDWSAFLYRMHYSTYWFRGHERRRSLAPGSNDLWWLWWPMISGDWWCLRFPDICLTVEEKTRKKPQPGNLSRPGIEPEPAAWRARMLPLAPQRRTSLIQTPFLTE